MSSKKDLSSVPKHSEDIDSSSSEKISEKRLSRSQDDASHHQEDLAIGGKCTFVAVEYRGHSTGGKLRLEL